MVDPDGPFGFGWRDKVQAKQKTLLTDHAKSPADDACAVAVGDAPGVDAPRDDGVGAREGSAEGAPREVAGVLRSLVKDISKFYGIEFTEVNNVTSKMVLNTIRVFMCSNRLISCSYLFSFSPSMEN